MKKAISFLISVVMVLSLTFIPTTAEGKTFDLEAAGVDMTYSIDVSDLYIRDPFILLYENVYFMYGTGGNVAGYSCYVSCDLKTWYGPTCVFNAEKAMAVDGFDGVGDYWAAECHRYNDSFYLFASYKSGTTNFRGTSVFKSESPLGPFVEISDGHITPHTRDCIDGTLYVENGVPYMVYVEEHTSEPDHIGGMAYAQLSDDLTHFVSDSKTIFKADSPLWVKNSNSVTDGPFLYKTSNGRLYMLWSTHYEGYRTTTAFTLNGSINGNWHQSIRSIYVRDKLNEQDGGHGMIFTDKEGRLMMVIHSPNSGDTRIKLLEIEDKGNYIIRKDCTVWDKIACKLDVAFWSVVDGVTNLFGKISEC